MLFGALSVPSKASEPANDLIVLPLLPHHEVVRRRRRKLTPQTSLIDPLYQGIGVRCVAYLQLIL